VKSGVLLSEEVGFGSSACFRLAGQLRRDARCPPCVVMVGEVVSDGPPEVVLESEDLLDGLP
jgi:hypothetical protein